MNSVLDVYLIFASVAYLHHILFYQAKYGCKIYWGFSLTSSYITYPELFILINIFYMHRSSLLSVESPLLLLISPRFYLLCYSPIFSFLFLFCFILCFRNFSSPSLPWYIFLFFGHYYMWKISLPWIPAANQLHKGSARSLSYPTFLCKFYTSNTTFRVKHLLSWSQITQS